MSEGNNHGETRPVVMKFGGSSLADDAKLNEVASFVRQRATTRPVVVVVSARGQTTDELVAHAKRLCDPLSSSAQRRELDMLLSTGERHSMSLLALTLHGLGQPAVSLTGSQCGIITDHRHGRARIVEVRPFRIVDELDEGRVVVVGGFQGVSYRREVTTLGRGGSDTTAVALAAALGADCEIYSDVDGIYTSDPRTLPEAQRLDELDPASMQALSRAGAKVLHARAVEIAQQADVVVYARRTSDRGGGGQTIIRKGRAIPSGVRAVAIDTPVTELTAGFTDASFGAMRALVDGLGALGLRYLSIRPDAVDALAHGDPRSVERSFAEVVEQVGARPDVILDEVRCRGGLGLVTCVGPSLEDRAELMQAATEALAPICVRGVHTDSHSLGFLVDATEVRQAAKRLHGTFIQG